MINNKDMFTYEISGGQGSRRQDFRFFNLSFFMEYNDIRNPTE